MKNVLVIFVLTVAAGCTVGPNFRTPPAPAVKIYTEKPIAAQTVAAPGKAGVSQRLVYGQDIPGQWWRLFHSKQLDTLVRRAIKGSPTIAAAQASLRQAGENLNARTATVLFPSVDGSFSPTRQKILDASYGFPGGGGSTFTLYNASVNVSYVFDVFGGERRELEALRAQVDYQRFLLAGAHLTLTANVATAAIQEASLRARIGATEQIVASQQTGLEMVQRRFALGGASRADVLAQQAQLAQTKATLPPLEKQLAQTRVQLAVLCGTFPAEGSLPEFRLEDLRLPGELPVSVPSSLVRQRPDIRASEELLHAAGAKIGVATANLYPQISLTAALGSDATRLVDLFSPGTAIWSIGSSIAQPLFHGGELLARRRAAIAACDQAFAQYRQTVLLAFQDVADVLYALEADARTLRAQAEAERVARASLDLTEKQFQIGAVNYLTLLNGQRQYQLALINLVEARAARFADTAALFQALGKGWWGNEQEEILPCPPAHR
ncbi:MAG: efflux transporter outer membrane subunit [Syntrophobacteraceae bacterium]|nr:efflux transporter outer membrane subunit [Syntrophobacteraceae bacterium]